MERLDWGFATAGWWHLFPQAKLANLLATISDHSPICLDTEPQVRVPFVRKFKLENMWLTEPELNDVVHQNWPTGGDIEWPSYPPAQMSLNGGVTVFV